MIVTTSAVALACLLASFINLDPKVEHTLTLRKPAFERRPNCVNKYTLFMLPG